MWCSSNLKNNNLIWHKQQIQFFLISQKTHHQGVIEALDNQAETSLK